MFGALAAGVVLGAKVPVVLSGRNESMEVRMASCVLASLVAAVTARSRVGRDRRCRGAGNAIRVAA